MQTTGGKPMTCTCRHFTRGTTPSFTFDMSVHLDGVEEMSVTFAQLGMVILEKNKEDIVVIDSDSVKITLTELETKLFSDKYDVECQFRIKYDGGIVITSEPPVIFEVNKMLHEG